MTDTDRFYCGDAVTVLKTFPDNFVDCVVTSPPYWGLRDYGVEGQIGLEKTPEEYVAKMVDVFREVRRVLKKDGTLWLNLGDSYVGGGRGGANEKWSSEKQLSNRGCLGMPKVRISEGLKPKDLCGIPWRVAFALQSDGWWLRQDIIWAKQNPMPESVTDRCTKSHEYVFLLAKSGKYYFDNEAIMEESIWFEKDKRALTVGITKTGKSVTEQGNQYQCNKSGCFSEIHGKRNKRTVWIINTNGYSGAHFATFPEDLIIPMIKAGCPEGGIVLDPFSGAGTTCMVAKKLNRHWIGIELNPAYIEMAEKRIETECGGLF